MTQYYSGNNGKREILPTDLLVAEQIKTQHQIDHAKGQSGDGQQHARTADVQESQHSAE